MDLILFRQFLISALRFMVISLYNTFIYLAKENITCLEENCGKVSLEKYFLYVY